MSDLNPGEGTARRYAWLWAFGLALGWFEAAVVIDLRALYYPQGFQFPLVLFSGRMAVVEVVREAASLVLIVSAASLSSRRSIDRFAAVLVLFSIWDLAYYAILKLTLGWPESFSAWDVLFLIPVIWTGPVWAPCVISATMLLAGSFLILAPRSLRPYRIRDWAIEVVAGSLVVLSFVANQRPVLHGGVPGEFPAWLFWTGWGLGVFWFFHAERRRRSASTQL